ncbi:cytosolic arginine sensor for mTORC1 subunit 1-like isoform X1 [Acropora muricata]|uniref:cytosolic arginine sensor for mTORC1 subunit 1-like isoform X1 n=1 Tax=Acropora millepora TaxID=45264 RepID=UPI0010FCCFC1|nr:cytosolic arginine sensor for mTORC1 subunit 1-like isoform X1 [Acropora millepora]
MNGCLSYSSELHILEHKLRVSNLKKEAISLYTHALIKISLLPRSKPRFFSFTETRDGYTIIVEDDLCKELPHTESIDMPDLVWRVLSVSAGAYGNNQLTGISRIVKTVITPLADCKVSVLVISTYQSDFVLVKEVDLDTAIKCLACNYKIFQDSGSGLEPVILSIGDRMDGMAKMIERKADEHRPIVHPFTCAKNRFHVTSLDCRILPSLTSILIDLMFYSNSPDDQGCESFFHLSIVEGDISLVLDSEALSRFPKGSLYTNTHDEGWKMIRVGDTPLGFDEFGVAAQIAEPLADVQMSTYYISTYGLGHTLVPESEVEKATELLSSLQVR